MSEITLTEPQDKTVSELVAAISALPETRGIVLSGSLARGYSDEYCDIDLGVLCSDPPSAAARLAAIKGVRDEAAQPFLSTAMADGFYDMNGQWVDVHYTPASEWRETVAKCIDGRRHVVEPWEMETFQNVHYSAPLHDPEGVVRELKKDAQVYPEHLKMRHAIEYAKQCCSELGRYAANESLTGELAYLLAAPGPLFPLFRCLAALDSCWYFGGWQMELYLDSFQTAPDRCVDRLRSIYVGGLGLAGRQQKQQQAQSLANEMMCILADAYPGSSDLRAINDQSAGSSLSGAGADEDSEARSPDDALIAVSDLSADGLQKEYQRLTFCLNQPPAALGRYAHRGVACWYHERLRDKIHLVVKVLMRLNHVEALTASDLDSSLAGFSVQPQDTYARIISLATSPDLVAVHRELTQLVVETGALVDDACRS